MRRKILSIFVTTSLFLFAEFSLVNAEDITSSTIGTVSSTSSDTPSLPSDISVTALSTNTLRISWKNNSTNQIAVRVTRKRIDGESLALPTLEPFTTTYTDYNLPTGTYSYTVSACSRTSCITSATTKTITIPYVTTTGTSAGTTGGTDSATTPTTSSTATTEVHTTTAPTTNTTTQTTVITATSSTQPTTVTTTEPTHSDAVMTSTATTTTQPSTQTTTTEKVAEPQVTIPTAPATNYAVQSSLGSVILSWRDMSSNETRFEIYRNASNGISTFLGSKESNSTTFTDQTITPGSYIYSISACNTAGCSTRAYFSPQIIIPETTKTTDIKKEVSTEKSSQEISKAIGTARAGSYINIVPISTTSYATSSYTATASHDGSFTTDKVPDGVYIVESFPSTNTDSKKAETSQVTITNGKVTTVQEAVKVGSKKLYGKVTSTNQSPITDAEIDAYKKETGQWVSATTNQNGEFSMELYSGTWTLKVTPKDTSSVTWIAGENKSVTFTNGANDEVQTVNFTTTPRNSNLTIMVQDEANNPIPTIGIIVDTFSGKDSGDKTGRQLHAEKTNSEGKVTRPYPAGDYFIRTSIPENLSYIPAKEQKVTLSPNGDQTITITLQKETTSNTIKVAGTTTWSDGTPTNAFIWAWSDQGGHEQTKAEANGSFTLTLTKNQLWHIGANKDTTGSSYKSSELAIDTSSSVLPVSLVFVKNDSVVLPPPSTIQKSASEQVDVLSNDGAQISLPKNSVNTTNQINVEIKPTTEAPSHSASEVVSTAYDITINDTAGQKITQLQEDAEITIPYDDAELAAKHITPEDLIPSYYDETISTWVPVTKFTVNKDKHVVVLHINHLTRYALIAAADVTPPDSPTQIVTDAVTPVEIKISWANPLSDFDHVKIYRSEQPGTLGGIIAAQVQASSFLDNAYIINGKTYYYTIRAVDTAGNESSNTNQVIFTTAKNSSLATNNNSSSLLLPPGQASSGQISRNLNIGSKGDDVTLLQRALKADGFYVTGPITGYFGPLTQNAVARFQNYYKSEVLTPLGLKVGTGFLGSSTRKKINTIILNELQ